MASVRVTQRFPEGAEVALHRRVGDWFAPTAIGEPVQTATAGEDGQVEFTGLKAGTPFWIVYDGHGVAATAKDQPSRKRIERIPEGLRGQTHPPAPDAVEGAADSQSAKPKTDEQAKRQRRQETMKRAKASRKKAEVDAAARRSAASKKAAATRKRNAAAKRKGGTTAGKA